MKRKQTFIQAYSQAPWRKQLQLIGLFLAMLTFITIIAGTYLNVAARTATTGREVQQIQRDIRKKERTIVNLETQLAEVTAARAMGERADDLDYFSIDPTDAIYLVIDGYHGRNPVQIAPENSQKFPLQNQLPLEHTQSLIEWLREQIYLAGLQTGAQQETP